MTNDDTGGTHGMPPRSWGEPGAYQTPHARNAAELQAIADAARGISPRRRAFSDGLVRGLNGLLEAFRRHWLFLINALIGTLIGLAFLAPIGSMLGYTGPSSRIFGAYRILCGQTPSHSFFVGGYQVCLCARCLAIYSSLLVFGLLLALLQRSRIRALNWRWWLVAMLPMALDGGTQLFGLRESNVWLRVLTGAIFGFATGWFLLPQIRDAASDLAAMPNPAVAGTYIPRPAPPESA